MHKTVSDLWNKPPMAKLIKSIEDFETIISTEISPGGKIIIYIFDEGTPSHIQLHDAFEKSAINSKFSKFFCIEYEKLDEKASDKYKIHTYPSFLVVKDGQILHKTEIETKERFLLLLKKFEI